MIKKALKITEDHRNSKNRFWIFVIRAKDLIWKLYFYMFLRKKEISLRKKYGVMFNVVESSKFVVHLGIKLGVNADLYDFLKKKVFQIEANPILIGGLRQDMEAKILETTPNNIIGNNSGLIVTDINLARFLGADNILDKFKYICISVPPAKMHKDKFPFKEISDFLNKRGFFFVGKKSNGYSDVLFRKTKEFNDDDILSRNISCLVRDNGIENIVETGTYRADTTKYFGEIAKKVYSIEYSPYLFKKAVKREDVNKNNNINFYLGKSQDILDEIIPKLSGKTLFFLDAHWGKPCPTPLELQVIARHKIKPYILIHDFKVPGHPELGFDKYEDFVYDFESTEPYLNDIYGENNYEYEYNFSARGRRRGVILVYEKNMINPTFKLATLPSEVK